MKHFLRTVALMTGLLAAVTVAESAPSIQGTASVIDGDTIEIHGERIRLDAIDAPESAQLCLDARRQTISLRPEIRLRARRHDRALSRKV